MTHTKFKSIREKLNKSRKWLSFQLGVTPEMISVYSGNSKIVIPDDIADVMEELENEI